MSRRKEWREEGGQRILCKAAKDFRIGIRSRSGAEKSATHYGRLGYTRALEDDVVILNL